MKKAYLYKWYDKDTDAHDIQCIDGQHLEGCVGFCCYYDLACYVLGLFTDGIIDTENDEKLQKINIDRYFIEDEIDKIRNWKKSLIDKYVDIIDVENVAKIPKKQSQIWYFLY